MSASSTPISSPEQLNRWLQDELQPIAKKNSFDDKWFTVGRDNKLSLYSRPNGFFGKLLECISRLIWNKYKPLEKKFANISAELERYLKIETNETRLAEFCNKYTLAINEIFRTSLKLHDSYKVAAPIPNFEKGSLIDRLFLIPGNSNVQVMSPSGKFMHPYEGHTIIEVENQGDSPIKFYEDNSWSSKTLEPGQTEQVSVKTDFIKDKFFKTACEKQLDIELGTKGNDSYNRQMVITVDKAGKVSSKFTDIYNKSGCQTVILVNESDARVKISLQGYSEEPGTKAMRSQEIELKPDSRETLEFEKSFSRWEKPWQDSSRKQHEAQNAAYETPRSPPELLPAKPDARLARFHCDAEILHVAPVACGFKEGRVKYTIGDNGSLKLTQQKVCGVIERRKFIVSNIREGISIHNPTNNVVSAEISIVDPTIRFLMVRRGIEVNRDILPHSWLVLSKDDLLERSKDYFSNEIFTKNLKDGVNRFNIDIATREFTKPVEHSCLVSLATRIS